MPRSKPTTETTATMTEAEDEKGSADVLELPLQRGVRRPGSGEEAGDLAHLRAHPRGFDLGHAPAAGDRGAQEHAVGAVGEAGLRPRCFRLLLDRRALAGEQRLDGVQGVGFSQARVRGHDVSRLEKQEIARDDLGRGDDHRVSVPLYPRPGRAHRPKRHHRALGPILLDEAHERVQDEDRSDGDGVGAFAQGRRDDTRSEEEPDQGALELVGQDHDRRSALASCQLVRAVFGQPPGGVPGGQPLGIAISTGRRRSR